MKKAVYLLFAITLLISCSVRKNSGYNPERKFSSSALKQDFSILQFILEHNHPSLYWNTAEDSVKNYFRSTELSLSDSLTELAFKNKVAWTLAKIRCGHTSVRSSKQFSDYLNKRKLPQFPLLLKVWKDSAVVTNTLLKGASPLKRGTIITAINSISSDNILDSICSLMGTDGFANTFKYQAISFNFPAYYRNAFGIDSQYAITYIDTIGLSKR